MPPIFRFNEGATSLAVVNVYNGNDQDFMGAPTVVLFDTFRDTPTGIVLSAGGVEITLSDKAKKWVVICDVGGDIQDSSGARWSLFLALNGTEIDGTRSPCRSSDLSVLSATMSTNAVVDLDVGDVLTAVVVRDSGADEFTCNAFEAHMTLVGAQNL